VWLHRGVYNCAVELATGKKTHKCVADTLCLLVTCFREGHRWRVAYGGLGTCLLSRACGRFVP
ncbi:hypothetical protein EV122DRAFT_226584, partial [Schizophyllum commune]